MSAAKIDFFISYTSANEQWAEWIGWILEEEGFSTKLQAWDFAAGSNFVLEMHRAADEATRTIAVLSRAYVKSTFAASEWAAAFAKDPQGFYRSLVPVRVEKCDAPGLLKPIVHLDLVGLDEDEARERLLTRLSGRRGKPSTKPQFPGGGRQAQTNEPPPFPGPEKDGPARTSQPRTDTAAPRDIGQGTQFLARSFVKQKVAASDLILLQPRALPVKLLQLYYSDSDLRGQNLFRYSYAIDDCTTITTNIVTSESWLELTIPIDERASDKFPIQEPGAPWPPIPKAEIDRLAGELDKKGVTFHNNPIYCLRSLALGIERPSPLFHWLNMRTTSLN